MDGTTDGTAQAAALPVPVDRRAPPRRAQAGGPAGRVARGLAGFALTGLSTMEVIGLAVAYIAVMGFLWVSGTVEPERLVSHAGFRTAWVIVALALVRPVTWIPYLLPFMTFRKFADELLEKRRPVARNLVAHLLTIGALGGVLWLLTFIVAGAVSAVLSGLAFLTGSGSLSTLGTFRGDWNVARVAALVAIALVVRLVVPPLDQDLGLSAEPVLWFWSGDRGRFDRTAFVVVVAGSALLAAVGAILARLT